MIKIQIKSIWGDILFEYEKENNTIKDTLEEAVKQGASLYGANLDGATNIPYIPLACPSDGAFIGWKKVSGCLVMLEIPEDAQRCSCTSRKCRCDKAKVLGITSLSSNEVLDRVVNHSYDQETVYEVGCMVYPDSFDDNRWNEYSHGIHFFINKQDAINY